MVLEWRTALSELRIAGQVAALSGHVAACHVTPSSLDDKVKNGEYTNLYLEFETLFEGSVLQLLSQSNVYKQRLKFICIDEVDCVSWASFREKWGCLGKLRTFFPKVQILVASATVAAWQYSLLATPGASWSCTSPIRAINGRFYGSIVL